MAVVKKVTVFLYISVVFQGCNIYFNKSFKFTKLKNINILYGSFT